MKDLYGFILVYYIPANLIYENTDNLLFKCIRNASNTLPECYPENEFFALFSKIKIINIPWN